MFSPLLFKIFLNELFLFVENIDLSNYADGSTLYSSGSNLQLVKEALRGDFQVTKWFYKNYMLLNSGKCHFMCLGKKRQNETFLKIYAEKPLKRSGLCHVEQTT